MRVSVDGEGMESLTGNLDKLHHSFQQWEDKDLEVSLLKSLHCLLLQLSPDVMLHQDILDLSNVLYKNLSRQFEQLLSGVGIVPPVLVACNKASLISNLWVSSQGFVVLLRCCMIMLHYLEFDLSLLWEKCQILFAILWKLCSQDLLLHFPRRKVERDRRITVYKSSVSHGCTDALDNRNVEATSSISFLCSILEVFIDEFLVNQQSRMHFRMADYVSDTSEKLFISGGCHGDINSVLELLSSHFLLSFYDELALSRYIHTLVWSNGVDFKISELSLSAALALLGLPAMFSAPPMLRAHLVLLASRCIGINMPTNDRKLDVVLLNNYMSAFEVSVDLYAGYMSTLQFDDDPIGCKGQPIFCFTEISFDSCIRPGTYEKLILQIHNMVDIFHQHSHSVLSRTTEDILRDSLMYIKENQHVIDASCREETCLILNCIILSILSGDFERKTSNKYEERYMQETYCLAALLKLMSSSLLQIVWFLRQNGCLGVCREYDFILDIFSCFRKSGANRTVQKVLFDVMGKYPSRHKVTKLVLAHFASLLVYSYSRRLEFLWKGCIFMMMTMMNLLLFEEGNLDALRPLLGHIKEASFPQFPLSKIPQGLVHRTSSITIASDMQNIQMLYLRERARCLTDENRGMDSGAMNKIGTQDGQSNTSLSILPFEDIEKRELSTNVADSCNGEAFIKCIPSYRNNPSDWDDLVDFIECKNGKDYAGWLAKRQRFRKWKGEKMAVVKHVNVGRKARGKSLTKLPLGRSRSRGALKVK